MTKEELEKEAVKCMHEIKYWLRVPIKKKTEKDGISEILKLIEPREKQIQALGERCLQLQKDKGNLTDRVKELEKQIEKMKCCYNCEHSRTEYEHCKTDKHEKWEIKEK